jgi:hypothetical protein
MRGVIQGTKEIKMLIRCHERTYGDPENALEGRKVAIIATKVSIWV